MYDQFLLAVRISAIVSFLVPSLQVINGLSRCLAVGHNIAPDVAIALVAGGFASIVQAFGLGQLAQEDMPEHVRNDLHVLILWQVGIGLAGDATDNGCVY